MYSIGEFSRITGLPIKTLRYYHELQLLVPSSVDDATGYRFYSISKVETARVIVQLRDLGFTLSDIASILLEFDDEADIVDFLERRRGEIAEQLHHLRNIQRHLDTVIQIQREAHMAAEKSKQHVIEKTVEPIVGAGLRMRGKYSECGKGFSKIGRQFGFKICGKPMLLIYDTEFKDQDADFEPFMPVRGGNPKDGIEVHELPGGKCISLIHEGPYEEVGRSYAVLLDYAKAKNYHVLTPCREIYIKGPGMIFKGNPKRYVTELQMLVRENPTS